jgi:hypothetical protein
MFELDSTSYSVKRGEELKVKVRRVAGSDCNSSVYLTTVPGSAVPGVDYEHVSTELVFNKGEVEKEATVRARGSGSGSQFSVEITGALGGTIVGSNWTSSVSIIGNSLGGEEKSGFKTYALGCVVVCGFAGLLVIVLVVLKRKKNEDHLIESGVMVNYTEGESLDQNE